MLSERNCLLLISIPSKWSPFTNKLYNYNRPVFNIRPSLTRLSLLPPESGPDLTPNCCYSCLNLPWWEEGVDGGGGGGGRCVFRAHFSR